MTNETTEAQQEKMRRANELKADLADACAGQQGEAPHPEATQVSTKKTL